MGPSKNRLLVQFDNPARSYFAGQVINGKVIVENEKPKKVKELTILLEGNGRVHWSEQENYTVQTQTMVDGRSQTRSTTKTRTVYFTANEKYVSQKISLVGDGHNLMTLPKGTTSYPFQFILPTNLPSSFTSKVGLVSYFVEAELRRPLLKPNKKMAIPFTVNGIFDLNVESGASQAQQVKKVKGSNFFACRNGQLGFEVKIGRSGYVSGEIVDFGSEITNGSNRKVNSIKASLIQVNKFHAQGKSKTARHAVAELKGSAVDVGEHEIWRPGNLRVPALPPSRLGGICRIIDVQYFLQFEMSIGGLSRTLYGELPIMIGTIPLRNTFDTLRQVLAPPQQTQAGFIVPIPGPSNAPYPPLPDKSESFQDSILHNDYSNPAPSAPILNDYPDLPPPTYAEAIMTESFNWQPEPEGNEKQSLEDHEGSPLGSNNTPSSSMPSAPPMYEFIPNYITYNKM